MGKELPVLTSGTYRKYPTPASQQTDFEDERQVCGACLSGACCQSEGPIAITSFDILRLASFFDMSPRMVLLSFTQDRFCGENEELRRSWIEAPDSSIITFLRRRTNFAAGPCIFLKFIKEQDGTPRRICGIHPARPLACREYYYDTCKKRWTGELAIIQSEGFEMIRDGTITVDVVEENLDRLRPMSESDSIGKKWQFAYWSEMSRALNWEAANFEGANGDPTSHFQDPIDEKINRMLSVRYLRFEEKYGLEPHSEQLQSYSAGLTFIGSDEYKRLLRVIHDKPRSDLYGMDYYPHYVGFRTMLPGVRLANEEVSGKQSPHIRDISLGWTFLFGLAVHAKHVGHLIELAPLGTFEAVLLEALLPFRMAPHKQIFGEARFECAKKWASEIVVQVFEAKYSDLRAKQASPHAWYRLYCSVARFDSKGTPKELRHFISRLRTETARHLSPSWRHDVHKRYLQLPTLPQTRKGRNKLINLIRNYRANQALRLASSPTAHFDRVVFRLEQLAFDERHISWVFDLLNILARHIQWSPFMRRRYANIALRWSHRVEKRNLWDGDSLFGWASLCALLGIADASTPGFERSMGHILSMQSFDGSWGIDREPDDLPDWQGDYILDAVRTTSLALEGLCAAVPGSVR